MANISNGWMGFLKSIKTASGDKAVKLDTGCRWRHFNEALQMPIMNSLPIVCVVDFPLRVESWTIKGFDRTGSTNELDQQRARVKW